MNSTQIMRVLIEMIDRSLDAIEVTRIVNTTKQEASDFLEDLIVRGIACYSDEPMKDGYHRYRLLTQEETQALKNN